MARTIPWESISDWYAANEQTIRDVMKFEGLRGAVNEVLRIAPDQPELAIEKLRADTAEAELAEITAKYNTRVKGHAEALRDLEPPSSGFRSLRKMPPSTPNPRQ